MKLDHVSMPEPECTNEGSNYKRLYFYNSIYMKCVQSSTISKDSD